MTVPKLRFKDDNGNDYPAWEVEKIGDVFNYIVDKKHPEETVLTIIQGIGTVPRTQSGIDISYNKNNIENYKKVKKNDFIVHLRSFQGGLEIANSDGIISPAYTVLRNKFTFYPKFFQEYFHTNEFINHNLNFVVEGVRDGRTINVKDLKKRPIPIPSLPEQKKIADFFSSFDKRIETTQKKLATLEKLKKGFMQKIFSQQLLFKDDNGNDYPAWEEKRLGEVTVKYKGNTLSKDNLDSEGMYPCLLYGELYTTYGPIASTILSRTNKLGKGMWVSEKDDVVVPVSGETAIDISTATCIKQNGVVIGGDLLILHSSRILGDFLSYSLNYPLKLTIAKYAQGASIVHMNIDSLMKVHIKFPSLPEQQKIADFLSAFDKKIDLVRKEVDTLQTIKKGLLQQMFV